MKWQNQKLNQMKQLDNKCHIPDLLQAAEFVHTAVTLSNR